MSDLTRNVIFRVTLVVSTVALSILAVAFGWLGTGRTAFDWIHRTWARAILAAAGVRVTAEGLEHLDPSQPVIIVANHQSYFDVWALMAALPVSVRFIAKSELSRVFLLGRAMQEAGHVFIDRDNARSASATYRTAGRRMRAEGHCLVLFPEGTRSPDGNLGRFRRGAFALALETGVTVVPTAISGGHHVFPPGARTVRRGPMTIRLAAPIPLDTPTPPDRAALLRQTRTAIEQLLQHSDDEEL